MRDNITGQGGGITEQSFENTFPKIVEKQRNIMEVVRKSIGKYCLEEYLWNTVCAKVEEVGVGGN